jgi:hypothetical protein
MMAKLGPFLLVPFLVLVATSRPGLVGLLHQSGSRPLAARVTYLPVAPKRGAGVMRAVSTPPVRLAAARPGPALPTAERREAQSVVIRAADPLYVLKSLQI